MSERVAAHDARNQANKLTKEEKKAKKKKKFEEDLKKSVFVLAFKVGDLSHPKLKFKVDATARENGLGGCAILTKENNLVIVEGGQKSVRKFKKVMLNKVKWNEEKKEENSEEVAVTNDSEKMAGNKCILMWEGNVTKPNFNGQFRFEGLPSEDAIRKYLNHRWSEHFWDMCKNWKEEDHSNELLPV